MKFTALIFAILVMGFLTACNESTPQNSEPKDFVFSTIDPRTGEQIIIEFDSQEELDAYLNKD